MRGTESRAVTQSFYIYFSLPIKLQLFANRGEKNNPKASRKIENLKTITKNTNNFQCLFLFVFACPECIQVLYSFINYHTDLITTQRINIQLWDFDCFKSVLRLTIQTVMFFLIFCLNLEILLKTQPSLNSLNFSQDPT